MTTVLLLVFPALMAFAASSDLFTMRISNRLILAIVAAFAVAALVTGMPLDQIGLHLAAGFVVLAVGFTCFAFGWIGGGDAKLAAVTTLWLGFGLTLPYLLYAGVLGGVLTLLILLLRRLPLTPFLARYRWLERLHSPKSGVPYGIALAIAGMLVYTNSAIFASFTA